MSATKSQVLAIAATYESQLAAIRSRLATDYDTPAQRIINRGLEAIGVRRFQGGDDLWEMLEALRNDVTEQGYVAANLTYAMRNMHRRTFTKEMVGSPIRFIGFNHESTEPDTIYHGNLVEILPRGIRISYYVPSVGRECEACLSTKDAKPCLNCGPIRADSCAKGKPVPQSLLRAGRGFKTRLRGIVRR